MKRRSLTIFKEVAPNKKNKKNKMSGDTRSVPDLTKNNVGVVHLKSAPRVYGENICGLSKFRVWSERVKESWMMRMKIVKINSICMENEVSVTRLISETSA